MFTKGSVCGRASGCDRRWQSTRRHPQQRQAPRRWCTEEVTKKWRDLTRAQRTAVLALASVQLSLAAAAWGDLAIRPAEQVVGGKAKWAVVIGINFVGPLLYFTRGRRASS